MLKRAGFPGRTAGDGAVVVCGGGAAGLAAAISAARLRAPVLLVESASQLGGTVADALIHTLAGFYDWDGELLNAGLPAELIGRLLRADPSARRRKMGRLWVLSACPLAYRELITRWIGGNPRITVLLNACVTQVGRRGRFIEELEISIGDETTRLRPAAVVDATGTADVARLMDESLVVDDEQRAAGGWIFCLRGVAHGALDFPKGVGIVRLLRAAALARSLPAECVHTWLDAGTHSDEIFVKLMVPLVGNWRHSMRLRQIVSRARETQAAVSQWLKRLPNFSDSFVSRTGGLGVRDGGRIRGRYVLTGDDVRQGRAFRDAVCRGAWPIELWDPQRGVSMEYLPPGGHYEIPMRSLQIDGVQNFWTAGKCLSADREAHASARVVGTCWAMGEAVGTAAAIHTLDDCDHQHEHQPVRTIPAKGAAAAR